MPKMASYLYDMHENKEKTMRLFPTSLEKETHLPQRGVISK